MNREFKFRAYSELSQSVVRIEAIMLCDKKEIFLHTPKNEIKGNRFDLIYEENNPMPKECEIYKGERK